MLMYNTPPPQVLLLLGLLDRFLIPSSFENVLLYRVDRLSPAMACLLLPPSLPSFLPSSLPPFLPSFLPSFMRGSVRDMSAAAQMYSVLAFQRRSPPP